MPSRIDTARQRHVHNQCAPSAGLSARRARLLAFVPVALVATLALGSLAPAQIHWESSLSAALGKAKATKRVVMIAIHMDGERACQEMIAEHYSDPQLVKLSRATVNLFCAAAKRSLIKGMSPRVQQNNDWDVRSKVLKVKEDAWVVAPQHVFLSPEGKILRAVPYLMTKGELEWLWLDAIRKQDSSFEWKLSDAARPPRRLRDESAAAVEDKSKKPPTPEEISALLAKLQKNGLGDKHEALRNLETIARSESPKALAFAKKALAQAKPEQRSEFLRAIGRVAPKRWWKLVETYLKDKDANVRAAAIRALRELGEAKAAKRLLRRFKDTKESAENRGRALIAMVVLEPKKRSHNKLLTKALRSESNKQLRVRAALAADRLEDKRAVRQLLGIAVSDRSAIVRQATLWLIAERRDKDFVPLLESALEKESDKVTKPLYKAALEVIEGKKNGAFNGTAKRWRDE